MSLTIDPWAFPPPTRSFVQDPGQAKVVLAGGCFWCTEAVYTELAGVLAVRPGYAGDSAATASYKTVCSGRTNHAEVIEVTYDTTKIDLGRILQLFFSIAHDPTEKDRQGGDVGRQYRSAIFYASEAEHRFAADYIAEIEAARLFKRPIATTLEPLTAFHAAEPEHHDYARRNPHSPYIAAVSAPKVAKLRKGLGHLLKPTG
jgi:peptide-methionine (S)-S-oxide reductase